MENYTPELVWCILLRADYDTIRTYSAVNTEAQEICNNKAFWIQKAQLDFDISSQTFKDTRLSALDRYVQLLTKNRKIVVQSRKFLTFREFVRRAIHQDRQDLVNYAIRNGFNDWDLILNQYSMKGDFDHVEIYFQIHPNYQIAAEGSLCGGYIHLFKILMKIAPSEYKWNWNALAGSSVCTGRQFLFKYVLSLAPSNYDWDWNMLIRDALIGENKYLFDEIWNLIPEDYELDWNELVAGSLESKNKEIFDFMLNLVPEEVSLDWNFLVSIPLLYNNLEFFDYIRTSIIPASFPIDLNTSAYSVLICDRKDLLNYILKIGPDQKWNWNCLCQAALSENNKELFDFVRELAGDQIEYNWNLLAGTALMTGCQDLFEYVKDQAPSDYQWNWDHLKSQARKSGNHSLFS